MGEYADYCLEQELDWGIPDWYNYPEPPPGIARPPLKLAKPTDFPLVEQVWLGGDNYCTVDELPACE
jgi:hypothetical protein